MCKREGCYYCSYNNEEANACNLVHIGYEKNEDGKMNYPIGDTCPCFADCCEDGEYINIRAKREKGADCLYKGKWESDWYNDETRLILVRDCGWHCIDADYSECRNCVAKEYCFETNDWILHKCDECEYFRNCDRKLDSCNDACDEFVERSV